MAEENEMGQPSSDEIRNAARQLVEQYPHFCDNPEIDGVDPVSILIKKYIFILVYFNLCIC